MTESANQTEGVDRLIDRQGVRSLTTMRDTALYAAIKHGGFPEPIQLGKRRVAWRLSEVLAWIDSRPRGIRPQVGE